MYQASEEQLNQTMNAYTYHPPKEGQKERFEAIRDKALEYSGVLITQCPKSRELSVALTKLDEVVMWANAAIARNE